MNRFAIDCGANCFYVLCSILLLFGCKQRSNYQQADVNVTQPYIKPDSMVEVIDTPESLGEVILDQGARLPDTTSSDQSVDEHNENTHTSFSDERNTDTISKSAHPLSTLVDDVFHSRKKISFGKKASYNFSLLFSEIERMTEYNFIYDWTTVNNPSQVLVTEDSIYLDDFLSSLTENSEFPLSFRKCDFQILVYSRSDRTFSVAGKVINLVTRKGVEGVRINPNYNTCGFRTDRNGSFNFDVHPDEGDSLIFTRKGFDTVKVYARKPMIIVGLRPALISID